MSADSDYRELKPGQPVLVFPPDKSASDATAGLGYHGTVVEIDEASITKHLERPDRWKYIVDIPGLNSWYRVRASHIVAIGERDASPE